METVMIFQRYISCGKIVFYCKLIATIKWKNKTDPDDRIVDVSALLRVTTVSVTKK